MLSPSPLTTPRPSEISEKKWSTKAKPFLTSHLWSEAMLKVWTKSWEPSKIYQLPSTDNPVKFHQLWHSFASFKVRTFWETHKIWKILPNGFDKSADLLSKHQNHGEDFFSNYVCFSKSPNFKWDVKNGFAFESSPIYSLISDRLDGVRYSSYQEILLTMLPQCL